MANVDSYLQPRVAITENMDIQHVQEVGGVCPLCGKQSYMDKSEAMLLAVRAAKKYAIVGASSH